MRARGVGVAVFEQPEPAEGGHVTQVVLAAEHDFGEAWVYANPSAAPTFVVLARRELFVPVQTRLVPVSRCDTRSS